MLAFIAVPVSSSQTITTPAGWNLLRRNAYNSTPDVNVAVYSRIASSEPGSYTWTMGAKMRLAGAIASYYGSSGVDVANGLGHPPSTNSTAPSVTTNYTEDLLVDSYGIPAGTGSTVITLPPTATPRWNFGPNGISLAMGDERLDSAGSTGNREAALSSAISNVGQLVALKREQ